MPTAPPGRNSRVLPHSDPPALGMEQPAAPQSPTGASSRLFHLPTPPGGCAQRGPPAGEDGSTHLPPGLSRNFSPTPLASTARSAVFPPPAAPRMEASAQRPRRVHFGKWGGGRTMAGSPLPLLCLTFARRLPSPSSPGGLRPCLLLLLPLRCPGARRPPTRKRPGVTPAAAAMETLPAPAPPLPSPAGAVPSGQSRSRRRHFVLATRRGAARPRPRSPLPLQPFWGPQRSPPGSRGVGEVGW